MNDNPILLVDTEKNVLVSYQSFLENEGFSVDIATSEQEALEKLSQKSFSVLITELYLKNTEVIKIVDYASHTPIKPYIIMITATICNMDKYVQIINYGIDDFFNKPFAPEALLANIKKGLTRRKIMLAGLRSQERLKEIKGSHSPPYHYEENVICNHTDFTNYLQSEICRTERYKHPFSLILLTINGTNDEYTLSTPGLNVEMTNLLFHLLSENSRRNDIITIYKTHLALILLESTADEAKLFAGRLQNNIEKKSLTEATPLYRQLMQKIKIDYHSYPEQSHFINLWLNQFEKQLVECKEKLTQ